MDIIRQNPSSPPFAKGRNYPSLAKRGKGRFSECDVFSIMDSLVNRLLHEFSPLIFSDTMYWNDGTVKK
jgi:hypothetical protein